MKKIVMIQRAACFSPGSVEKDWAILYAVGERLRANGEEVRYVPESLLSEDDLADVFLSMGRLPKTLEFLQRQSDNALVINTAESILHSSRIALDTLMRERKRSRPFSMNRSSPFWNEVSSMLKSSPIKTPSSNQKAWCTGSVRNLSGLESVNDDMAKAPV